MTEVLVLGRDEVGVVAESDGMRYYLTPCCGASATGTADYVGCRACYAEVDPALGGIPDIDFTMTGEFIPKPLALIETYGDGLPYETWKVTR
jgi:hypothetical protein